MVISNSPFHDPHGDAMLQPWSFTREDWSSHHFSLFVNYNDQSKRIIVHGITNKPFLEHAVAYNNACLTANVYVLTYLGQILALSPTIAIARQLASVHHKNVAQHHNVPLPSWGNHEETHDSGYSCDSGEYRIFDLKNEWRRLHDKLSLFRAVASNDELEKVRLYEEMGD